MCIRDRYYQCDVEINGKMFYRVGIRPKGNTSLTSIANDPTTDRFSLKLEFDQFVKGQTCFGLDKLVLNNNFSDATNMKEALIYDMYQYLGADASLYNFAKISVNNEYWGVDVYKRQSQWSKMATIPAWLKTAGMTAVQKAPAKRL